MLALAPVDVRREDLHHVFFGVALLADDGAVAVGGDVELFVVVQHAEDVAGRGRVDDGGGDELVHRFVVRGMRWVVDEAGATAVD